MPLRVVQVGNLRPIGTRPLNFAIVGTRGIPARYGGFETFAEEQKAKRPYSPRRRS